MPTEQAATLQNSESGNVLTRIIAHKRQEVALRKQQQPLSGFLADIVPSARNFLAALQQPGARFILECKKASPSKGLIRPRFDLNELAAVYQHYADCISVLTDEKFFQGSYDNLQAMRSLVDQPLLHKDFIIDPYQIYLGRYYGADAVLLMLSVLTDDEYRQLAGIARQLNMTVLTEVSNTQETHRAVALEARLIGINNRDLRTLQTDLNTTFTLADLIPAGITIVSESGIYNNQQVRQLSQVSDAFLVGSSLMAQADLNAACQALVKGEHKVCGLTRNSDALAAYQAGATFGGLIFYPPSPRNISLAQAKAVQHQVPLRYVGVFVNETPEQVAAVANTLQLAAVQLHGDEDDTFIRQLKPLLPAGCEIWKAYRVADSMPQLSPLADRLLLDAWHPQHVGGSGQCFNWQLLQNIPEKPLMLAGGLTPENAAAALKLPVTGLDFNSGLESQPGIKDTARIQAAFNIIREFRYE